MDPSVVACGRCGASNPQDVDFCETCGAFLAAYQAPAGATETVTDLTRPAESTPTSEISYTPPAPPPAQAPAIVVEEPPRSEEVLDTGLAEEEPIPEVQIEAEEVTSEPVPNEVVEPVATTTSVQPHPAPVPPPRPRTYAYTPPQSPPQVAPEPDTPIPAIYKALFGRYAEFAYPADRLPGTGRTSPSPQTIILIGVAALLGVCVAAMVASSSSVIFLLIGGPIACSLIAIGILILVGRHPTGRP